MTRVLLAAALAVVFGPTARAQDLVIRNVTVIDGTGHTARPGLDVCIVAGVISEVARGCTASTGTPVLDGTGQFLLPGFIDMHVHLLEHGRDAKGELPARVDWQLVRRSLRLLLEHGVTTVRDPGSETEAAVTLRELLARRALRGPRLLTAGRIINTSAFNLEPFQPVRNADELRAEIRWQKAAGVDFIKIYSATPPELVRVAVEEAHGLGLPVIGHLQRTTWTEAARLGIDQLAHAAPWTADLLPPAKRAGYTPTLHGRIDWLERLDLRAPQVDTLIEELTTRGVSVDATLIAMHTKFFGNHERWLRNEDNQLLPAELIEGWRAGSFTRDWTPQMYAAGQRAWPHLLAFTKRLHDGGVRLTVGTDAPTAWIVPGAALHDELTLLRDAGIPERAILRMATADAARALRREHEFGSVTPGLRADLVVLTRDPLERIENTRAIAAVIQDGRVVCALPRFAMASPCLGSGQ